MIITIKEYDALTDKQLNTMEYSNPCTVDENHVRVGEVLDDYLGYWRTANENDF